LIDASVRETGPLQRSSLFRGLPFLDSEFPRLQLLDTVAQVRRTRDEDAGRTPLETDSYLNPVIARDVYSQGDEDKQYTAGASEATSEVVRCVESARIDWSSRS
jgi:hypothetical protein